jgi:hypothetical protein
MNIATFLLSMVAPMVVRAIIALGFTAVSFVGVTDLTASLVSTAQSNWSSLPAAVLQLAALSGVPQSLGMVFGALNARVAMWAAVAATRYVAKVVGA